MTETSLYGSGGYRVILNLDPDIIECEEVPDKVLLSFGDPKYHIVLNRLSEGITQEQYTYILEDNNG